MPTLPEFYPLAEKRLDTDMNLVVPFKATGITIHYTASGSVESAHNALKDRGLNYHFIIDRNGDVVQSAKLTHSVYHAGKAMWNGASPNRKHVAIALVSWGFVSSGRETWAGTFVPYNSVRERDGKTWHKATAVQEAKLILLCRWLVQQGINPENVCGHDECCIPAGRKSDPGGVLSMPVSKLRQLLHSVLV